MTARFATRTLAGRSDLLRSLAKSGGLLDDAAAWQLGFAIVPLLAGSQAELTTNADENVGLRTGLVVGAEPNFEAPTIRRPAALHFWRPERLHQKESESPKETREQIQNRLNPTGQVVPPPRPRVSSLSRELPVSTPLSPVHGVTTRVRNQILTPQPAGVDMDEVVKRLSRGQFLERLPTRTRGTLGHGFSIWLDRSIRLTPYWDDQIAVAEALLELFPREGTSVALLDEGARQLRPQYPYESREPLKFPAPGTVVIILGDLGALHSSSRGSVRFWCDQGMLLQSARCRAVAVVPCDQASIPAELARFWEILPWDPAALPSNEELRQSLCERVLGLLGHSRRVEPGLVRDVRRLLPEGRVCPGMEATLWQNGALASRHSEGGTLELRSLKILRERFDQEHYDLKVQVTELLKRWRPQLSSIWCEEAYSLLSSTSQELLPDEEQREIVTFFEDLADWAERHPQQSSQYSHVVPWLSRAVQRLPRLSPERSEVANAIYRIAAVVCAHDPSIEPPEGMKPGQIPPVDSLDLYADIFVFGRNLQFTRRGSDCVNSVHSPFASIRSGNGRLAVEAVGHDMEIEAAETFWADGEAPDWAVDWGVDEFGLWVDLAVPTVTTSVVLTLDELPPMEVRQRMRWIAPGTFRMGSPESEPGRFQYEGPQHDVRISRGFWLFDTPCTQALYEAVTGKNPSKFKSADRPVERVDWNDGQSFCRMLSETAQVECSLPTEAEWEYACRAGTSEALYCGPIEILGTNNAPALDAIAWYGGNCGVEFDLEDGVDSEDWPAKQYPFPRGGSRKVGQKSANAWGLHDMLGNVEEWCLDKRREYTESSELDPVGSVASASRVIRGGSWRSYAQGVRAAYRDWFSPGDRDDDLGFRCRVRGAEPSQRAVKHGEEARAGRGRSPERAVSKRSGKAEPRAVYSPANGGRRTAAGPVVNHRSWIQLLDQTEASAKMPNDLVARIESDAEELTLRQIRRPDWAYAIGRDEFGLWADLKIGPTRLLKHEKESSDRQGSRHVMRIRWIPPGQFLMGSPQGEPGRLNEHEFEPRLTVIADGFWMFETPVTQAIYELVMGNNPSRFVTRDRPVEQVSWHDCQKFCSQLSQQSGLHVDLPGEVEWEYACRAGTTTATYAGPLEILGDANAPKLDEIAWYGGNSNFLFDLENGVDVDWLQDRQYANLSGKSGTHSVKQKRPNPWGLYDMLGNVWEWCSDSWRSPTTATAEEPSEPSADRVIRGGGWYSYAQNVRAAYRLWYSPDDRGFFLGFRCRVREFQPGESPDSVSAKRSKP